MKKFLKHITIFILSLSSFLSLIFIITNNKINNKSSNFKIRENINYLILGHSHTEGAFNDSLIGNTRNLSSSAELQFYTYLKTKKILEENNQIKTVFLGYSNNQITKDMEKWTTDEEKIKYNIPKYAPSMSANDFGYIFKKNPKALLKSFQFVLKDNLDFILERKENFINAKGWGSYNYMDKTHIDSLLTAQKVGRTEIQDVSVFSDINLEYLTKTIKFCKNKGVKLYLLRSPLHREYLGLNNETLFQNTLSERYFEVVFLDFRSFPLNDNQYRDFDHLNYKGAKKFSLFFNKLLKNKVFEKENAQLIINEEMNMLRGDLTIE